MIHEEGRLQVIDFGVAGVLQTNIDKRSTVIGTPHWMAPELHKLIPQGGLNYGTEVSQLLTSDSACSAAMPQLLIKTGGRLGFWLHIV